MIIRLAWRADPVRLATLLALTLLSSLMPVGVAVLMTRLLDSLTGGPGPATVELAILFAVVSAAAGTMPFVEQYVSGEFDRRVGYHSQAVLFDAVNRLTGLGRLEQPQFHERLLLAQHASRLAPGRTIDAYFGIGQAVLTVVGFLVALASTSPWLALFVLLATVPLLPTEIRLSRRRVTLERAVSRLQRREGFYQGLLTRLDAAKEVRLFGLGDFFRDRMLAELYAGNALHQRLERRQYLARGGLAAFGFGIVGAGLVWMVGAGQRSGLSAGDVTLYLASAIGVTGGVQMICNRAGLLHEMLLLMEHYQEVTVAEPDLPTEPRRPQRRQPGRGIEFHDVWFRYGPDLPWVLRGVDLVLPAGKAVGLVGVNGAGKSTIVKLLCRFYDPTRGSITWDGVDLRAVDVAKLRERIGVVFQDFMDYDLSAHENIAVGDLRALGDRDRIIRAARQADIHAKLESLPRGYRTVLSRLYFDDADGAQEGTGVLLSGGQWQRVALARAFLRDSRDLLILDEPSSGLDAEAEHEMHQRLRALRHGRASLLISHRLNSIRDADHIVVLEDGAVTEKGTHADLMEADGRYATLFGLQAAGYGPDAGPLGAPETARLG